MLGQATEGKGESDGRRCWGQRQSTSECATIELILRTVGSVQRELLKWTRGAGRKKPSPSPRSASSAPAGPRSRPSGFCYCLLAGDRRVVLAPMSQRTVNASLASWRSKAASKGMDMSPRFTNEVGARSGGRLRRRGIQGLSSGHHGSSKFSDTLGAFALSRRNTWTSVVWGRRLLHSRDLRASGNYEAFEIKSVPQPKEPP